MQRQPRLPLWFLIANWALIAAAFLLGLFLGGRRFADLPQPQAAAMELVYNEILRSHVDPQDGHAVLDHAIAGMVGSLDPYSAYVPPSGVAKYVEDSTGHYEGIGLVIRTHGDDVVAYYPFAGGPAELAGVLPGDLLIAIDDQVLATTEQRARVRELLRGPAGSEVRLRVRRNEVTSEIVVPRGDVQRSCANWAHFIADTDGLGYVHLSDFHPGGAGEETGKRMAKLGALIVR